MPAKSNSLFQLAVIVSALGFFVDTYDLLLFAIIRKQSLTDLGLSPTEVFTKGEMLISIQMIGIVLGGIVFGILGDKAGRIRVLFGSIILYSAANILNGMITSLPQYIILRFIAGVGLAGELGAGVTLVSELLPKEKRSMAAGLIAGFGLFGVVTAVFAHRYFDWRTCYYIGGALGILLLLMRIQVHESGLFANVKQAGVQRGNFLMFFTSRERFLRYLKCILIGVPAWYVIGILITFSDQFAAAMHVTGVDPGTAIMYLYLAIALGDFSVGWLCEKLKSRKKTLFIFYAITILFAKLAIERITPNGLTRALQIEVLAMRGTAYAEMGNLRLAAQSFDDARALDPMSAIPYIEEVPVLLQTGQKDRAKAAAARAIQLAPNSASAWNMQASILHDALDIKGALAAYDRSLNLDPGAVDARIARVGIFLDLNRNADAERDLTVLFEQAPEEPRAAYLRAQVALRNGDPAKAKLAYGEAAHVLDSLPATWLYRREQLMMLAALSHHGLGNLQKAQEYLDIIVNRYPRNEASRKLLATVHLQMRDFARALPLLETLLRSNPNDPLVLFQIGSAYLGQNRFPQAVEMLERALARTPAPEISRALAFAQIGLGREDMGQATLEKVLVANPGDEEAGNALAQLYMRREQRQKALKVAVDVVKRAPTSLARKNFLGTIKAGGGDRGGARALFEQILSQAPGFLPAVLNLAKLDASEGKYDAGRKRLQDVLAKRSGDVDLLYELGVLEQRAGRNDEALRHFKKASESQRKDNRAGLALIDLQVLLKQSAEALASAKALASKYPEDLSVQIALGRTYVVLGDMPNARSVFQLVTKLAEFDADQQVAIARLQLLAGNPDGASYNVQKALQGRADDLAAMTLAVEVEAQRKDPARADAALKALAAKYPNRAETALAAAALASSRSQFDSAVASYRTALSREESTSTAISLAIAMIAAGDLPKAVGFLEGWVKARPGDHAALKALAEAQFRAGNLASARASYTKALATEPDNAGMLNNLANLLFKLGDPGARVAAERAFKLNPDNPAYADTLGWILVQKGEMDAGLRYLREARLRGPENGEIRLHLAAALAKIGRRAEAQEELRAAISSVNKVQSVEELARLRKELGL